MTQQIGGDHYIKMAIQPIEFILKNNIGFAEGNVIKYVSRWREKGGVEDLKKARHYLDMLIESQPMPVKQMWTLDCGEPSRAKAGQLSMLWDSSAEARTAARQILEMLIEKGLAGDADPYFYHDESWVLSGTEIRGARWVGNHFGYENDQRGWVWTTRAGAEKALDAILEEMK